MTAATDHEVRMLVDGKLIEADSGRTFDNVNPATEEVLGPVADASAAEMHRAIDAARRAFDETDWSTNRERRKECLGQLQDALEREREELREELILEVGCPRMTTHANQLDIPLDGALKYPIKLIDEFPWRSGPARGRRPPGHRQHAADLEGARRRRRRDRAVELPPGGHAEQARPGARHRQHGGAQAGARHAVERHSARAPRRGADRVPARRPQRRDLVGPSRGRGADAVAQGRPDLVHRFDRRRQAHHGEGRADPQARLPRARREVGHDRARRRRLRHLGAFGHRGVLPRRPGLRDPDPDAAAPLALRRGRRDPQGDPLVGRLRGSPASRRPDGAGRSRRSNATACSATSRRAWPRGRRSRWAAGARRTCPRVGSWSRRCSPTWTTP